MFEVKKSGIRFSFVTQIIRTIQVKEFAFSMILFLLLLIVGSCATNNMHGKHRYVPCPCETERYR